MPVQVIENRRLYRQIADQVQNLINSGEFAPGDRLPPERDLAAKLGVSRATVREAMIALELAGLVDIRTGAGIFVCPSKAPPEPTKDDAGPGPFELLDARRVIESGIAALAAVNITNEELAALADVLDKLRREQASGADTEESDRSFHVGIARGTHNALLVRTVIELWEWRRSPMWMRLNDNLYTRKNQQLWLSDHERIFEALYLRDPEASQAGMRDHLARVKEELLKVIDDIG